MAVTKSYTDIEQSRKLAEILPIESADMFYVAGKGEPIFIGNKMVAYGDDDYDALGWPDVLCWSLAALLGVLPEYNLQRTDWGNKTEYKIVVTTDEDNYASKNYDNPVDACYEMILKLHKLNLL